MTKVKNRTDDILCIKDNTKRGDNMRIDSIKNIYETYKKQSISPNKAVSKTSKKDEVELSSVAKDFQAVYKLLQQTPDIRAEKVDDLKAKINSGNYNVKAEEVADKILSHLDLKG